MEGQPSGHAQHLTTFQEEQIVLLLVGLIGSGKSTFAQALEEHVPRFRRCNQDDLGDRRAVEARARKSLSEGLSVCIDRTNFDAQQRATWINIAREFPGALVWVLVFDTPYEVCEERLRTRTGHPTITTPEQGLSVLARFSSQLRLPAAHEGHTRILYLRPEDHPAPTYSAPDVLAVLQRLRDAPAITPRLGPPPTRGSYQPRGSRGAPRSRGYGYNGFRGAAASSHGAQSPYGKPGGGGAAQGSSNWRARDDRDHYQRPQDR